VHLELTTKNPLPRVGISRCLLGDSVRYDGGHKLDPTLVGELSSAFEWVPVCPEVEVGMGVPREPIELVVSASCAGIRLLGVHSADDWTQRMREFAIRRVGELRALGLAGFVLKARSPSCGVRDVPVRGSALAGRGMFADVLATLLPALPVEDEERLRAPDVRVAFIDRVRAYQIRSNLH
jgi:uncharacterized protein YbbK (DUF523 family)